MVEWDHVIIHHSGTPDTDGAETHGFRHYHKEVRGWRDIGYHFVVEKVGGDYAVVAGRPLNLAGAHTIGMNSRAIGVCLAGNFNEAPAPLDQIRETAAFLAGLMDILQIPTDNIEVHRDHDTTDCPGNYFIDSEQLYLLKSLVNSRRRS